MLTPSVMPPLGMRAPDFDLPDANGKRVRLADFDDRPLLVAFLCAHCPATTHIAKAFGAFADEVQPRLAIVGINANDDSYPEDRPEHMAETAERNGWRFPFLYDETQDVALAYRAACTPDFYLFDRDRKLAYRGQFDGSRPSNNVPVSGIDLRAAVEAVLAGRAPSEDQKPSIGCNIKWRRGAEPDYFHPTFVERVVRRLRRIRL
jgi:peroxiredoxin